MARFSRTAKHGTISGYQSHIDGHTAPCEACSAARKAYMRRYRNKGINCAVGLGWPLAARRA